MLIGTVIILNIFILGINFIDSNFMANNFILNDLNGINIILGIISIPCCFYIIICIKIMSFYFEYFLYKYIYWVYSYKFY